MEYCGQNKVGVDVSSGVEWSLAAPDLFKLSDRERLICWWMRERDGYGVAGLAYTHGFSLIILTVFDVIVMGLIWHEYRLLRNRRPTR
jgi:hypothetical protein